MATDKLSKMQLLGPEWLMLEAVYKQSLPAVVHQIAIAELQATLAKAVGQSTTWASWKRDSKDVWKSMGGDRWRVRCLSLT